MEETPATPQVETTISEVPVIPVVEVPVVETESESITSQIPVRRVGSSDGYIQKRK